MLILEELGGESGWVVSVCVVLFWGRRRGDRVILSGDNGDEGDARRGKGGGERERTVPDLLIPKSRQ